MAEPIYDILFTVDRATPSVTPTEVQPAGYYGDDKFARVTFAIPLHVDRHRYRIEIVDGNGAYDITELLEASDALAVSYVIPQKWTAPGIATLQLVELEIGDKDAENAIAHYPPVRLLFENRNASQTPIGEEKNFELLLAEIEMAAIRAKAAADIVEKIGDASQVAADARAKAETALKDAIDALRKTQEVGGLYTGGGEMPDGYDMQIDFDGAVFELDDELNGDSGNPVSNRAVVRGFENLWEQKVRFGREEPTGGNVGDLYIQIIDE